MSRFAFQASTGQSYRDLRYFRIDTALPDATNVCYVIHNQSPFPRYWVINSEILIRMAATSTTSSLI
jgi:hypothetical protein